MKKIEEKKYHSTSLAAGQYCKSILIPSTSSSIICTNASLTNRLNLTRPELPATCIFQRTKLQKVWELMFPITTQSTSLLVVWYPIAKLPTGTTTRRTTEGRVVMSSLATDCVDGEDVFVKKPR